MVRHVPRLNIRRTLRRFSRVIFVGFLILAWMSSPARALPELIDITNEQPAVDYVIGLDGNTLLHVEFNSNRPCSQYGLDPMLFLLDQTGGTVAFDDDGNHSAENCVGAKLHLTPPAGTYTLRFTRYGNTTGTGFVLSGTEYVPPVSTVPEPETSTTVIEITTTVAEVAPTEPENPTSTDSPATTVAETVGSIPTTDPSTTLVPETTGVTTTWAESTNPTTTLSTIALIPNVPATTTMTTSTLSPTTSETTSTLSNGSETTFAAAPDDFETISDSSGPDLATPTAPPLDASEDEKREFESEVNVFGGGFDDYVAAGSNVTVAERRTLIAVAATLSTMSGVTGIRRKGQG